MRLETIVMAWSVVYAAFLIQLGLISEKAGTLTMNRVVDKGYDFTSCYLFLFINVFILWFVGAVVVFWIFFLFKKLSKEK